MPSDGIFRAGGAVASSRFHGFLNFPTGHGILMTRLALYLMSGSISDSTWSTSSMKLRVTDFPSRSNLWKITGFKPFSGER